MSALLIDEEDIADIDASVARRDPSSPQGQPLFGADVFTEPFKGLARGLIARPAVTFNAERAAVAPRDELSAALARRDQSQEQGVEPWDAGLPVNQIIDRTAKQIDQDRAASWALYKNLGPDPETASLSGSIVNQFADIGGRYVVGSVVGGTGGGMLAVGSTQMAPAQQEQIEAGVDPMTAAQIAAQDTAFATAGVALPAAFGTKTLTKVLAGVGLNVPLGIVQRKTMGDTLREAGYGDLAERYQPFDMTSMAVDAIMGAGFGLLHVSEPRAIMPPEAIDAAMVTQDAQRRDMASPHGVPLNNAADRAIAAADARAMEQIANGEPVDVADIFEAPTERASDVQTPEYAQIDPLAAERDANFEALVQAFEEVDGFRDAADRMLGDLGDDPFADMKYARGNRGGNGGYLGSGVFGADTKIRDFIIERAAGQKNEQIAADYQVDPNNISTAITQFRARLERRLDAGEKIEKLAEELRLTVDVLKAGLEKQQSAKPPEARMHVLRLAMKGLSNPQIAERMRALGYEKSTPESVKVQKSQLRKLGYDIPKGKTGPSGAGDFLPSRGEAPAIATPKDTLQSALSKSFGKSSEKLLQSGKVEVLSTVDELRALTGKEIADDVKAVHASGKTYVVAENVSPQEARGILLHEVGVHHGMEQMLGEDAFGRLKAHVEGLLQSGHPAVTEARALAEAFSLKQEHIEEETLAYLVEHHSDLPPVRRLLAQIRQWLWRAFPGLVNLTPDDIAQMAVASLRRVATSEMRVWHGSPHEFSKFDLRKLLSGEGANAYGPGIYVAENVDVGRSYREALSYMREGVGPVDQGAAYFLEEAKGDRAAAIASAKENAKASWEWAADQEHDELRARNERIAQQYEDIAKRLEDPEYKVRTGLLYEASLKFDPVKYVNWDAPFSSQSPKVQRAMKAAGYGPKSEHERDLEASMFLRGLDEAGMKLLLAQGVKGIQYLDQGSRGEGRGTRNFVVFDDKTLKIKRRMEAHEDNYSTDFFSSFGGALATREGRARWANSSEVNHEISASGKTEVYRFPSANGGIYVEFTKTPYDKNMNAWGVMWDFVKNDIQDKTLKVRKGELDGEIQQSFGKIVGIIERFTAEQKRDAIEFTGLTEAHTRLYSRMLTSMMPDGWRAFDISTEGQETHRFLVARDAARVKEVFPDAKPIAAPVSRGEIQIKKDKARDFAARQYLDWFRESGGEENAGAYIDDMRASRGKKRDTEMNDPVKAAISDDPSLKVPDEQGRDTPIQDALDKADEQIDIAKELSKGFEAAGACAARHAQGLVSQAELRSAEMTAGFAWGAAAAGGIANAAIPLAQQMNDNARAAEIERSARADQERIAEDRARFIKENPVASIPVGRSMDNTVMHAAERTGVPEDFLRKLVAKESGGDPNAQAGTSTATGATQFLDGTWSNELIRVGPKLGFKGDPTSPEALALRNDPRWSVMVAAEFAKANAQDLKVALGRDPTHGEVYLAHFMGIGGALSLIRASDQGAEDAKALFPSQAAANASVFQGGAKDVVARQTRGFSEEPFVVQ